MVKKQGGKSDITRAIKWQELEKGIELALNNAERLNSDAQLLFRNRRYPSSRFYALVAKEEIGKAFLLADHWVAKKGFSPQEYKAVFKSGAAHANKLTAAGRAFYELEAWRNMGDLFARFDLDSKEQNLYVDYHESGDFGYWAGPTHDFKDYQELSVLPVKDIPNSDTTG